MPDQEFKAFLGQMEASASVLGRISGPEQFTTSDVAMTAAGGLLNVNIPRTLVINRPIADILVSLRGRITVTVAPYTSVAPEALQNLLQNITITGAHKDFGNLTPINLSGATAFQLPYLFQGRGGNTIMVNGVVQQTPNGRPLTSAFTGAVGTHDFFVTWRIPTYPMLGLGQSVKRTLTSFLWKGEDWSDSLQLQIRLGDATALGDTTGATVAFTAFESAAGSPLLTVALNYAPLSQFEKGMRMGIVLRQESPVTNQQTALATGAILQTLQRQITPHVLLKTATIATAGLTAGIDRLDTLSDRQLDSTQITVDNKPVRNNQDNLGFKAIEEAYWGSQQAEGYFDMSFVEGQNPLLAYRGDGLAGGSQLQVVSNVRAASANNRQRIMQEMIWGGPFPAQR